jgi:Fe-S-cluster containining protein
VDKICQYLNIGVEEFMESYGKHNDAKFLLKDNFDAGCCFLENNYCQIYPVRPLQCRTYPFWPENLKSHYRWKQLIPLCPGIGKGGLHHAAWIRQLLKKQKTADG